MELEKPWGAVVQFGGQTAIKLAKALTDMGVPILGTSSDGVDAAEDRERFDEILQQCGIPRAAGKTVFTTEEALAQMDWTALLYEEYAFGHDLDEFQAPEADTSMGFGYLKEKERLEPYLDATSQAYGIKANLLIEIRNFFISSPSELVQEDEINWFAGEGWGIDRLGFTLEPSSVRQETYH